MDVIKVQAKQDCVFLFGSDNKAIISVNRKQVWYIIDSDSRFYVLERDKVKMQIPKGDFGDYFEIATTDRKTKRG